MRAFGNYCFDKKPATYWIMVGYNCQFVTLRERFPATEGSLRRLGDASRLRNGVQHDSKEEILNYRMLSSITNKEREK
jgi:hypothetical protein